MISHEEVLLNSSVKDTERNQVNDAVEQLNEKEEEDRTQNLKGDKGNLALLLLLYMLQGIPLASSSAIPMLLQKRGATYQQQAQFTVTFWPFTLKLLWAPIVDSCFSARFGRRKSWLIPVQYLIGLSMIGLSFYIDQWMGDENNAANIGLLVTVFFMLTFFAATQDVCVDGWSLTLLKRCNLGYASICNSVGHSIASLLGYTLFISLESAEFCNIFRSKPQADGIITVKGENV